MLWVKVAPSLTCARTTSYSEHMPINRSSSAFPFDTWVKRALCANLALVSALATLLKVCRTNVRDPQALDLPLKLESLRLLAEGLTDNRHWLRIEMRIKR